MYSTCTPVAAGRKICFKAVNTDSAVQIANAYYAATQGATNTDTPITVTLHQAEQAGSTVAPESGPVYRVTVALDCFLDGQGSGVPGDYSYVYIDGVKYPADSTDGSITGIYSLDQIAAENGGTAYYRASNICDIQLPVGHTMTTGSVPSYQSFDPVPSIVEVGPVPGPFCHFVNSSPLAISGQTFTRPATTGAGSNLLSDGYGITVTVQF